MGLVGTPQALTGAGAANITTAITNCTSSAAGQVVTLADGAQGQIKIVCHVALSNSGTVVLTPATLDGGTTITMNAIGDSAVLLFNDSAWIIIGGNSAVVA